MGRNESVFREIQPDTRIVIEHVVKPWYRLTVTLTARGDKTHLAWVQEFESPEVAAKMRRLSDTANEQKRAEVEINGGCWMEIARRPPCSEGAAEYQGKCYVGVGAAIRSPTSIGP